MTTEDRTKRIVAAIGAMTQYHAAVHAMITTRREVDRYARLTRDTLGELRQHGNALSDLAECDHIDADAVPLWQDLISAVELMELRAVAHLREIDRLHKLFDTVQRIGLLEANANAALRLGASEDGE